MSQNANTLAGKSALITGAAHRIGAVVASTLHAQGMNLVLHYRHSRQKAQRLQALLHDQRPDSVVLAQADLRAIQMLPALIKSAESAWGGLDALVNNASRFYPTPLGDATEKQWDELIDSNLKAPFFLSQAAAPLLKKRAGCIINIVDIYADRPLKSHPVYSISKAGLAMLTRTLAQELGPDVRANGVAPGAILWPEAGLEQEEKREILERIPLQRRGDPQDIARAVLFLIRDAGYINGHGLAVDGGRSLNI
jgi:pteridine reductase